MKLHKIKENFEEGAQRDPFNTVLHSDKKWKIEEFFEVGKEEIKGVMNYLKSLNIKIKNKKVLDFGCGVGRLTQPLASFFEECYGVDISERMINLAKKFNKHKGRCHYQTNFVNNLNIFPDNHFDFIYSNITLQHMNPKYSLTYIKEFLRILKPNGIILFQLPSKRIRKVNEKRLSFLLKSIILETTPEQIINFYKQKRWGFAVNMYPIKKEKILKFVEENGGNVIDIIENDWGGNRYNSLRYCVIKQFN